MHQTVYVPTVKAFEVCVPPVPEQKRITAALARQLAPAESARQASEAGLAAVTALPAALLARAFAGHL